MKKPESKKGKKEIKKSAKGAVPAGRQGSASGGKDAKKTAPKVKKEAKKTLPAHPAAKQAVKPESAGEQELKPKKAVKEATPKIEVPKQPRIEKAHVERAPIEAQKVAPEKKKPPKIVQYHGTGGRKTSGARVWISQGTGRYIINGKPLENYTCKRNLLLKMAMEPFVVTNTLGKYDVQANANGGGICSQIGAVRQAVSVAIMRANPEFRAVLKKAGLLTRDSRMKERKKFGQKRARKRFQYSKR